MSEPCNSTDRTKDAMNPGKCCLELKKKSANTHTHTHMRTLRRVHFSFQSVAPRPPTDDPVFVCEGAGLPGDAGSVAMVTESASIKSEGQED